MSDDSQARSATRRRWRARWSRRAPGPLPTAAPTRLGLADLLAESLSGMAQRGARTALTMLGTIVGVGAFVTVLGLTTTATGQVSSAFSVLAATQVTVTDTGRDDVRATVDSFPPAADGIVAQLNGVQAAGRTWQVIPTSGPITASRGIAARDAVPAGAGPNVWAASPGYLDALEPRMAAGRLYDEFSERRALPVAVLGPGAARQLGVTRVGPGTTVTLDRQPYTVVGILADVAREPATLSQVFIPAATARARYGPPSADSPAVMLVRTKLGAAPLIARQAPLALRPDRPVLLRASAPPETRSLATSVLGSLNVLFVALAAITLLVGAVNITTTTLVAVMERTGEIGLRRSLGATPGHITAHILAETAAMGTLGGLIGTAVSIVTVLAVAVSRSWTAVIDPGLTLPAPLLGTLAGLLAGLYPARRAARIQPLDALRR